MKSNQINRNLIISIIVWIIPIIVFFVCAFVRYYYLGTDYITNSSICFIITSSIILSLFVDYGLVIKEKDKCLDDEKKEKRLESIRLCLLVFLSIATFFLLYFIVDAVFYEIFDMPIFYGIFVLMFAKIFGIM